MRARLWPCFLLLLPAACTSPADRARADSAQALVAKQRELLTKLVAQKDSVSGVLVEASNFIGQIDSSVSRVKGLRAASAKRGSESAIQDQIAARRDLLHRVNALVQRAQQTARELQAARQREADLLAENVKLKDSIGVDLKEIDRVQAIVKEQAATILALQARVDSLDRSLGEAREAYARAYYVVGTEDDLLKKGVVVREGGANLLIAHPGRTLQPAREINQQVFTAIDTRRVNSIPLPDTSRSYQIVSRQSLDDAKVQTRDGAVFRGPLAIADVDKFWAPSRYLIIVER